MRKLLRDLYSDKALYLIASLILLPGIIFRFYDLNIDPPQFFNQLSRALLTDPYNVTHFARNKALFGEWDIFDYPRWIAFKYSLSSGAGYIFFSLFGVSRVVANLSALFLNLGGIFFFLSGLKRESIYSAIIAALVLIPSMVLSVYGRYPFLENGLIFLCGLLYFVFIRYYPQKWILFFSGIMISLCLLSGKLFGIVMVVPIALVIWIQDRRHFLNRFGLVLISWIVSLMLLALLFYGGNIGTVYRYLQEQTVGMYGVPDALTSPLRLIENLMIFGSATKFYYFSPFVTAMLFIALVSLILRSNGRDKWLKENRFLVFNIGWLVAGYLLLMFPNYRPLRYQLFLLLPIAGIIGSVMSSGITIPNKSQPSWPRRILLFYVCWFFVLQYILIGLIGSESKGLGYEVIWPSVLAGILLPVAFYYFRNHILKILHYKNIIISLLLLTSVAFQYHWSMKWFDDGTHAFQTAGKELGQELGADAVIIGPYAQSLTIDNNIRSFIYMFGMANKEPNLFGRFPFTHLANDASNLGLANIVYPELKQSYEVTKYWIRDVEISIERIDRAAMGLEKAVYHPSDYERAIEFVSSSQADSAYICLDRFLKVYPRNRAALLLMPELLIMRGYPDEAFEMLRYTMSLYPDDFSVFIRSGFIYYRAYLITRSETIGMQADRAFNMAVRLNPSIAERIPYIKEQARGMSGSTQP